MSRIVIAMDDRTDTLWLRYLPGPARQRIIINPAKAAFSPGQPHYNNVIGWRGWFRKREVVQLHCYQPGRKMRGIVAAALLLGIDVTVHLTGGIESEVRDIIKLFGRNIATFSCAGDFIAEQLEESGIDGRKITIHIPQVQVESIGESRRLELRERLGRGDGCGGDRGGPVLLALERPGNSVGLKPVIWSASLLKHILRDLTLVVAGECPAVQRDSLLRIERAWDSEGMIHLDNQRSDWDELVGVCDVVVAGADPPSEVIRLLHARSAGAQIVAGSGRSDEFLIGRQNCHIVSPPKPRRIAAAILPLIDTSNEKSTG